MSEQTATKRHLPWEDRWHEPQVEQLFPPIQEQPRRALKGLMSDIEKLGKFVREVCWYGPAWKWTIEYRVPDQNQVEHVLCYLVPSSAGPLVCVPFSDDVIAQLPMRRLNKFVRNGIRSAKCAVAVHWATWNLTASTEAGHLTDLVKRKHKIISGLETKK
jgi:hypothetical protein